MDSFGSDILSYKNNSRRWINPFTNNEQLHEEWIKSIILGSNEITNQMEDHELNPDEMDQEPNNYGAFKLGEDPLQLVALTKDQEPFCIFTAMTGQGRTPVILRGVSEYEEKLTALIFLEGPSKMTLNAFATDYYKNSEKYMKNLGEKVFVQFTGWALSVSHQTNPPNIKRPDGKEITTAGSTILLPQQTKSIDEYVYQFYIKDFKEYFFHNYSMVIRINTRLAILPEGEIPLDLYATERIMQDEYYPEKGHDIMGIFILCCNIIT